jgi:DNA sulfur modification protein DndD
LTAHNSPWWLHFKARQAAEVLRGLFDEKKASLAALKEIRRQLVELTRQRASLQGNDADNTRLNALIDQLQLEYGNLLICIQN